MDAKRVQSEVLAEHGVEDEEDEHVGDAQDQSDGEALGRQPSDGVEDGVWFPHGGVLFYIRSAPSACAQSQSMPDLYTTTQLTRRVSRSVAWQS